MPRMIHHFRRVDEGQHRGYPQYQVGTKRLKNAEEFDEAELERNYVGSCMAAFVRSDLGLESQMDAHSVVTDTDGRRIRDIQPSMIHYVGQNDEVQFSNPSGAPQSFEPYMEHEGRMFSAGAGCPYELMTGKWKGIPYNGARIVWNQEEATIDVLQLGLSKAVTWLYRHFITRLIEAGLVDIDPVSYRSEPWLYWGLRPIPPARMSLDPSREDRNELVLIEAGVKPHSDFVERKTGQAASKIYRRINRNRAEMEENGIDTTMPQMGRDEAEVPTQIGDDNQESSDANEERQAVGV
jgi:capsid protein